MRSLSELVQFDPLRHGPVEVIIPLNEYGLHGILTPMAWEVEYSDEFKAWWDDLSIGEQVSIDALVLALEELGPGLTRARADTIHGSAYPNMRELRIQHQGRPYRVLYAFDPRRTAFLLLGGDKTGNARWYEENVPKADAIFKEYLAESWNLLRDPLETLKREGKI